MEFWLFLLKKIKFVFGWVPATGLRIWDGVAVDVEGVEESRTCIFTSSWAFNIDSYRPGDHCHKKTILH